jgi:hypothetical protein
MSVGDPIQLVAGYYRNSYGEGDPRTMAIGWADLTIGRIISDRTAPARVDHNGEPIGWAPWGSITLRSR